MAITNPDRWLTYTEAAEVYGVSKRTLQRLRANTVLTGYQRGTNSSTVYLDPAELDHVIGKPMKERHVKLILGLLPERYHAPILATIALIDQGESDLQPLYPEDVTPNSTDLDELLAMQDRELEKLLRDLEHNPPHVPDLDALTEDL